MTKLPSWLFFPLYNSGLKKDEIESIGTKIVKSLQEKARFENWDPSILERALYINEHDDCSMYGITEPKYERDKKRKD